MYPNEWTMEQRIFAESLRREPRWNLVQARMAAGEMLAGAYAPEERERWQAEIQVLDWVLERER